MYLAGRKVRGRGFISGYDKLLPERLPEDKMAALVKKLRTGDDEVVEDIIVHHLALTISLVGRYVSYFPNKSDDLMGVAALALTESVKRFAVVGVDDNIAGYITSTIHGTLARYLQEEDNTIQVTTRGFEKAVKKAKEQGGYVSKFLPQTTSLDTTVGNSDDGSNCKTVTQNERNTRSVSTSEDRTGVEIDEILAKCNFTRFEMLVYERLVQGMQESDIARDLNYSRQRINQIKKDVLRKLEPYYGDKKL